MEVLDGLDATTESLPRSLPRPLRLDSQAPGLSFEPHDAFSLAFFDTPASSAQLDDIHSPLSACSEPRSPLTPTPGPPLPATPRATTGKREGSWGPGGEPRPRRVLPCIN